jgi:hypothetical protein
MVRRDGHNVDVEIRTIEAESVLAMVQPVSQKSLDPRG